ncbi:hypothetical protein C9426_33350 [Serratia sp. S1B]|nr:hypothetical protein C9426_33350 [Serratia sp. S1B]
MNKIVGIPQVPDRFVSDLLPTSNPNYFEYMGWQRRGFYDKGRFCQAVILPRSIKNGLMVG